MAPGPPVEFGGVFVVRETETALLCRIGEKSHWVAHSRLQPGSTVEHPGDRGVLVLPWDFAVEFWDGAMSDERDIVKWCGSEGLIRRRSSAPSHPSVRPDLHP